MGIDWFTVGAQLVNFLVLVYLLKRFLYKPVVAAMAAREKRIADRIAQAADREREANERQQTLDAKLTDLEARRDELEGEIREQVNAERGRMLDALRDEVAGERTRWRESVERENEAFARELRGEVADAVLALSRRALGDLADATLERSVVDCLVSKLRALDQENKRVLEAFNGPVTVATSFELDADQRSTLARALREASGVAESDETPAPISWQRDASLVCGARVRAGAFELGWAIDDYLDQVSERVRERLASQHR